MKDIHFNNNIDFGKAIEEVFQKVGITKTAFAQKLGIHKNNLGKMIFDKSDLKVSTVIKASEILGYDFFSLIYIGSVEKTQNIHDQASGTMEGDIYNVDGGVRALHGLRNSQLAEANIEASHVDELINALKERIDFKSQIIDTLKQSMKEKDELIALLKEKIINLQNSLSN